MAKKQHKVISEVSLKDPNQVIDLPRVGLYITKDNLTVKRYMNLIALNESFAEFFNVKYNPKNDENELEAKK